MFFDRDGVLNVDAGYTHAPEALRWNEGAREAVAQVNRAGWLALVITNQAGIARGLYDEEAVRQFHDEMQRQLAGMGARIDGFVFCPHHPEGSVPAFAVTCPCRKPQPGMILAALDRWSINRDGSFLIGDRQTDIEAARAAGIEGRLYVSGDLRGCLSGLALRRANRGA